VAVHALTAGGFRYRLPASSYRFPRFLPPRYLM
jgi:hypothetical protein